jgi:WD40 repeat protein
MSVKIFFCYAHADEDLLKKLKIQLSPLLNQGLIDVWHDRNISAGTDWEQEIKEQLNTAQIILLLVSPDFMASKYINTVELKRAIERHQRGEARVIPIILRPVYWQGVLGKLQALPTDAKPVVDRYWHTLDEALNDVAEGIRIVVEQLAPIRPEAFSLLRTITGHAESVHSVAFSPDGQTLASGSGDDTIKLWNLVSGQELRTLTGHTDSVRSVAISPDGQTLASGSHDDTIKQWKLASGQEVRTLKEYTGFVLSVAFSPDGQTLASGGGDDTIKLWNLASGQELRILTWHTNEVSIVAFSPDGQTLASGSYDHTIKLWNLASGQEVRTLTGHTNEVSIVAFSPDGQTLASGSGDNTIKIWGEK